MTQIDWTKIDRYFTGGYSGEDEQYVLTLFSDPEKKDILKSYLSRQWKEFQRKPDIPEKNLDHILHRIHYSINVENDVKRKNWRNRIGSWYYRIAAVLLLPLMIGGVIAVYNLTKPASPTFEFGMAEIHSTMGSRVSFNLPDGSKGWLNSGSTLRYPMNFKEDRKVELTGEAYFDVVKSKSQPFYVKTSDIQIKVLGTQFNVKSYPDDKTIETTLVSGMIEIETLSDDAKERRKLILNPNQKATFRKGAEKLTVQNNSEEPLTPQGIKEIGIYDDIDPVPITSWKDSKLIFINEPFESLLKKMERWYDVEIKFKDSAIDGLSYTGIFQDETVEQALKALKLATPDLGFTLDKNKIEIYIRKGINQ
ncbi:MAG: DUF4974 domain-containing protein [Bacteroidales bacterium]|nr:DUF4974 domain-containing protein [Bacteroidales bacterium]